MNVNPPSVFSWLSSAASRAAMIADHAEALIARVVGPENDVRSNGLMSERANGRGIIGQAEDDVSTIDRSIQRVTDALARLEAVLPGVPHEVEPELPPDAFLVNRSAMGFAPQYVGKNAGQKVA